MKPKHYQEYIQILREELIPAMGCTEPIALAYAAARARRLLGQMPQRAEVRASGSVIKNVKSVIVPNTGHMRGIPAACAAGIAAGDPDAELEVLAAISPEQVDQIRRCMEEMEITVLPLEGGLCSTSWSPSMLMATAPGCVSPSTIPMSSGRSGTERSCWTFP